MHYQQVFLFLLIPAAVAILAVTTKGRRARTAAGEPVSGRESPEQEALHA
jgi:hypothetical protein